MSFKDIVLLFWEKRERVRVSNQSSFFFSFYHLWSEMKVDKKRIKRGSDASTCGKAEVEEMERMVQRQISQRQKKLK